VEQVSPSAWNIAQQFGNGPFAASAQEAAADFMRQTHDTFEAMGKMAAGGVSESQKLMSDNQRRTDAILRQISENAQTNTDAAFDACAAAAKARSLPEALLVQAQFVQDQFAAVARQSQDLLALAFAAPHPSGRNGKVRKDA
jgi:hypothetical protein